MFFGGFSKYPLTQNSGSHLVSHSKNTKKRLFVYGAATIHPKTSHDHFRVTSKGDQLATSDRAFKPLINANHGPASPAICDRNYLGNVP